MVDGRTGQTYGPTLSNSRNGNDLDLPQFGTGPAQLDFRLNSRLLLMSTCEDTSKRAADSDRACFKYYFLWEGDKWRLLRKDPAFE